MLDSYGADICFLCKGSFGWKFAVMLEDSGNNIIPKLFVQLQISRAVSLYNFIFHLVILFSPKLVLSYIQKDCIMAYRKLQAFQGISKRKYPHHKIFEKHGELL